MTVSNSTPLVENKTGNGSWSTITVSPGLIYKNSDGTHAIKVIRTTIADGTTLTLAETTDYTVALDGSSPSTGTITLVAGAPSSAYRYTVISNLTATQDVDLQNGTTVNLENIESSLDKLTLLHQVQSEKLERAVILAEDTLVRNLVLGALNSQAGKILRVNSTEDGFDYTSFTTTLSDGDFGDVTVSSNGTVISIDPGVVDTAELADGAVETAKINDGAVTTAKINDDAVTLAKMASGTAGNLITYDASGNPAVVTTGTSGQILTSNGAGVAPTFQDAAAGGGNTWELITNTTIGSGETAWEFTGLTGAYDMYRIEFEVIRPVSSGAYVLLHAISGVSYLLHDDCEGYYTQQRSGSNHGDVAASYITPDYTTNLGGTNNHHKFTVIIEDGDANHPCQFHSYGVKVKDDGLLVATKEAHWINSNTSSNLNGSATAFRVYDNTAAVSSVSGSIKLYGYNRPTS